MVCADKLVPRVNPDPAAPKASPAAAAAVVCGAAPRPKALVWAAVGVPNENPPPAGAGAAAAVLLAGVPKLKEPAGLAAG